MNIYLKTAFLLIIISIISILVMLFSTANDTFDIAFYIGLGSVLLSLIFFFLDDMKNKENEVENKS